MKKLMIVASVVLQIMLSTVCLYAQDGGASATTLNLPDSGLSNLSENIGEAYADIAEGDEDEDMMPGSLRGQFLSNQRLGGSRRYDSRAVSNVLTGGGYSIFSNSAPTLPPGAGSNWGWIPTAPEPVVQEKVMILAEALNLFDRTRQAVIYNMEPDGTDNGGDLWAFRFCSYAAPDFDPPDGYVSAQAGSGSSPAWVNITLFRRYGGAIIESYSLYNRYDGSGNSVYNESNIYQYYYYERETMRIHTRIISDWSGNEGTYYYMNASESFHDGQWIKNTVYTHGSKNIFSAGTLYYYTTCYNYDWRPGQGNPFSGGTARGEILLEGSGSPYIVFSAHVGDGGYGIGLTGEVNIYKYMGPAMWFMSTRVKYIQDYDGNIIETVALTFGQSTPGFVDPLTMMENYYNYGHWFVTSPQNSLASNNLVAPTSSINANTPGGDQDIAEQLDLQNTQLAQKTGAQFSPEMEAGDKLKDPSKGFGV